MDSFESDLEQVHNKLHELAWKLRQVPWGTLTSSVPRGLFRMAQAESPTAYLEEIRADLTSLSQQVSHEPSARLIAGRIHAKVDLLVRLCVLHGQADVSTHDFAKNLMTKLVTRRQHVEAIESQIASLELQQSALKNTLATTRHVEQQLAIQSELGHLERQLTQARDML